MIPLVRHDNKYKTTRYIYKAKIITIARVTKYTTPPSSLADNAALLRCLRNSKDNILDNFKVSLVIVGVEFRGRKANVVQFGGSVVEATINIRIAFVRKVYSILLVLSF